MTRLARLLEACEPARSAVAGSVLTTLGWIKFGAAQHAREKKFYARHLPANSPPNATGPSKGPPRLRASRGRSRLCWVATSPWTPRRDVDTSNEYWEYIDKNEHAWREINH